MPMTASQTDAEVASSVADLPYDVRLELEKGPMDEPRCRVCSVLTPLEDHRLARCGDERELWDRAGRAAVALLDYHAPCARDSRTEQRRSGPEQYRRCLQIYDAARAL